MYRSLLRTILISVWVIPFLLYLCQATGALGFAITPSNGFVMFALAALSALALFLEWLFSFRSLSLINRAFSYLLTNNLLKLEQVLENLPVEKCYLGSKSILKVAVDAQVPNPTVLFLLSRGATITQEYLGNYNLNYTLFYLASYYDYIDERMVHYLISKGADINFVDDTKGFKGLSLLHAFVLRGHLKVVNLLIRAGADPRYMVEDLELDALMLASRYLTSNSCIPLIKLLAKECNVNNSNSSGYTPLLLASEYNPNANVVRTLVELGARIGPCRTTNQNLQAVLNIVTPLRLAVINNNFDVIYTLIKMGDDPCFKDSYGFTILFLAAAHNTDARVIDLLIEHGASLEESLDIEGNNPLMAAAFLNPSAEIILYLANITPDLGYKNQAGYMFLDYLKENSYLDEDTKKQLLHKFYHATGR